MKFIDIIEVQEFSSLSKLNITLFRILGLMQINDSFKFILNFANDLLSLAGLSLMAYDVSRIANAY